MIECPNCHVVFNPSVRCSTCFVDWDIHQKRMHINVLCRLMYEEVSAQMRAVRKERHYHNMQEALKKVGG